MELRLKNIRGESSGVVKVRDDVFGVSANRALVHQVMVGQLANARQGTASVKTRAQVSGGGRKPHPQKSTGSARAGSIRAPNWRGGGVVFGPHPRSYRHRTPKKMRRLALMATMSDKVRSKDLVVLDELVLDSPKTGEVIKMLGSLGVGSSVLLVADGTDSSVLSAARNISGLKMLPCSLLNAVDLLNHRKVIMTLDAVRKAESLWGGGALDGNQKSVEVVAG